MLIRPTPLQIAALLAVSLVTSAASAQVTLYDNGPFLTDTGTGSGGADESVMEDVTLSDQTLGVAHAAGGAFDERVADQFMVPTGEAWAVDSARFFVYELNSGTTSTVTAVNVRIWNGPPGMPGSAVVFGDTTTNRLVSSQWTNVYRASESTSGNATTRPVMEVVAQIGAVLPSGTYWMDWQTDASGGDVFAVPVTIPGQAVTGDAEAYSTAGGPAWNPVLDSGSNSPKGVTFQLIGQSGPPGVLPVPIGGAVGSAAFVLLLTLLAVWRLRAA